jgi:hypothetical protein
MGGGPIRRPVQPMRSTHGFRPIQPIQPIQPLQPIQPIQTMHVTGPGQGFSFGDLHTMNIPGAPRTAAKPVRGCSLAAADVRAKVKVRRNGDARSTTVKHSVASVIACEIADQIPMSEIGVAVSEGSRATVMDAFDVTASSFSWFHVLESSSGREPLPLR